MLDRRSFRIAIGECRKPLVVFAAFSGVIHRTQPVHALFEQERPHLLSVPEPGFRNVESVSCKVDKYATVRVDLNRYSVPTEYVGFKGSGFARGQSRPRVLRSEGISIT